MILTGAGEKAFSAGVDLLKADAGRVACYSRGVFRVHGNGGSTAMVRALEILFKIF